MFLGSTLFGLLIGFYLPKEIRTKVLFLIDSFSKKG